MGVFLRVGGEFLVVTTGLNPDRLELTMTLLLLAVGSTPSWAGCSRC